MTDGPVTRVGVAEAKRRFSDLLGEVRFREARFVIERNGTPMAALVPLSDIGAPASARGFRSLVGAFADAAELPEILDAVADERASQPSRPAPLLGR